MKLDEVQSFEDLKSYLRHFTTWHDDPYVYDIGGVTILLISLLENLQEYDIGDQRPEVRGYFKDDQLAFLVRLAEGLNSTPAPGP